MKRYTIWVITLVSAVCMVATSADALNLSINDSNDIHIHGFISQGYLKTSKDIQFMTSDTDRGTAEFNEMGINFSTSLSDNLKMGLQLFAFDLGDIGNDEVTMDWAYGDYSFNDYIGIRAGIIRLPMGLYNETRDIDMVRTSILLPSSVYPEWFRDAAARIRGASVYGALPGGFSYQILYGKMPIDKDGGLAKGFEALANFGTTTDINSDYTLAGSLQWEPVFLEGLKLGVTGYKMKDFYVSVADQLSIPSPPAPVAGLTTPITMDITFDQPLASAVFSAEFITGNLKVAAEYALTHLEFQAQVSSAFASVTSSSMTLLEGYYGSVSYRFFDRAELGVYYSEYYADKNDKDGFMYSLIYSEPDYGSWLKDACLSLRYDITPQWTVKAEYHNMDGTYMALNDVAKDWNLYALKTTFSF